MSTEDENDEVFDEEEIGEGFGEEELEEESDDEESSDDVVDDEDEDEVALEEAPAAVEVVSLDEDDIVDDADVEMALDEVLAETIMRTATTTRTTRYLRQPATARLRSLTCTSAIQTERRHCRSQQAAIVPYKPPAARPLIQ